MLFLKRTPQWCRAAVTKNYGLVESEKTKADSSYWSNSKDKKPCSWNHHDSPSVWLPLFSRGLVSSASSLSHRSPAHPLHLSQDNQWEPVTVWEHGHYSGDSVCPIKHKNPQKVLNYLCWVERRLSWVQGQGSRECGWKDLNSSQSHKQKQCRGSELCLWKGLLMPRENKTLAVNDIYMFVALLWSSDEDQKSTLLKYVMKVSYRPLCSHLWASEVKTLIIKRIAETSQSQFKKNQSSLCL